MTLITCQDKKGSCIERVVLYTPGLRAGKGGEVLVCYGEEFIMFLWVAE
jgi:hypothetical protein